MATDIDPDINGARGNDRLLRLCFLLPLHRAVAGTGQIDIHPMVRWEWVNLLAR